MGLTCPHCGDTHTENSPFCPNTGQKIERTVQKAYPDAATVVVSPPSQRKGIYWLTLALGVMLLLAGIWVLGGSDLLLADSLPVGPQPPDRSDETAVRIETTSPPTDVPPSSTPEDIAAEPTALSPPTTPPQVVEEPAPPEGGPVAFTRTSGGTQISNDWDWDTGGKGSFLRIINSQQVIVSAGAETDQWEGVNTAPQLSYETDGDFIAQVKVTFVPDQPVQHAGIGIGTLQKSGDWIRITRTAHTQINGQQGLFVMSKEDGRGNRLISTPYTNYIVFFRIERSGDRITLSYSPNQVQWTVLLNTEFDLPTDLRVFLVAYSTNDEGIQADFADFSLEPIP
jgi:regulation of enolase protein 1 (concanavalin A-like superfamily)